MTEREQQGFFLDALMIPPNPNDEEDRSIWLKFDYFPTCIAPDKKKLPSPVRELRAKARRAMEEYKHAVATFAIKPTWYELHKELQRREDEHKEVELALINQKRT